MFSQVIANIANVRTRSDYQSTANYAKQYGKSDFTGFADWLRLAGLSQNTVAKHCRQLRTLLKRLNDVELRNTVPAVEFVDPDYPQFTDEDFRQFYGAFADLKYPKFITDNQRPRYWHSILYLVALTAIRRQALLGLRWQDVNFNERFISIRPATDKKHKQRYKPITADLADELLNLRRFYYEEEIPEHAQDKVFPWFYGNKQWYQCWREAETKLGKRFHLHDLKRFSGELALRAGATQLELQQHMDHNDIKTTLKHYARPTTTKLVQKMRVPLPGEFKEYMPLFSDPELRETLEMSMLEKLRAAGIDLNRLVCALRDTGEIETFGFGFPPVKTGAKCKSTPTGGRSGNLENTKNDQRIFSFFLRDEAENTEDLC